MTTIYDVFKAGYIELTVNNGINLIPFLMKSLRSLGGQKYFMYKNDEDFVFGWVLGRIIAQCEFALSGGGWRNLEAWEYQELSNILKNKMAQIRNKITETG